MHTVLWLLEPPLLDAVFRTPYTVYTSNPNAAGYESVPDLLRLWGDRQRKDPPNQNTHT